MKNVLTSLMILGIALCVIWAVFGIDGSVLDGFKNFVTDIGDIPTFFDAMKVPIDNCVNAWSNSSDSDILMKIFITISLPITLFVSALSWLYKVATALFAFVTYSYV